MLLRHKCGFLYVLIIVVVVHAYDSMAIIFKYGYKILSKCCVKLILSRLKTTNNKMVNQL